MTAAGIYHKPSWLGLKGNEAPWQVVKMKQDALEEYAQNISISQRRDNFRAKPVIDRVSLPFQAPVPSRGLKFPSASGKASGRGRGAGIRMTTVNALAEDTAAQAALLEELKAKKQAMATAVDVAEELGPGEEVAEGEEGTELIYAGRVQEEAGDGEEGTEIISTGKKKPKRQAPEIVFKDWDAADEEQPPEKEEQQVEVTAPSSGSGPRPAAASGPPLPHAIMFPGEGSEQAKMLDKVKDLPAVKSMLETAKSVLGFDLLQRCLSTGKEDIMSDTELSQPALFIADLAGYEKLRVDNPDAAERPSYFAGMSIGEYAALCAAGVFTVEEGLRIVKARAAAIKKSMQGVDSIVMTVLGMEEWKLQQSIDKANERGIVQISTRLSDKNCEVAGLREVLIDVLNPFCIKKGAKRCKEVPNVPGIHCPIQDIVRQAYKDSLAPFLKTMQPPRVAVIMNTGEVISPGTDPASIVEKLGDELARPVQWQQTTEILIGAKLTKFFEVGPGKRLKELMRRNSEAAGDATENVGV